MNDSIFSLFILGLGCYMIYLSALPLRRKIIIYSSRSTLKVMFIFFIPVVVTGVLTYVFHREKENIYILLFLIVLLIIILFIKGLSAKRYYIYNISRDQFFSVVHNTLSEFGIPYKSEQEDLLEFKGGGMIQMVYHSTTFSGVLILYNMEQDINETLFYEDIKISLSRMKKQNSSKLFILFLILSLGVVGLGIYKTLFN